MISSAIFFNVIVLTIAALQVFDQAYLLFWRDQNNASPESSLFYGVYLSSRPSGSSTSASPRPWPGCSS